jgi:hypothetical protein
VERYSSLLTVCASGVDRNLIQFSKRVVLAAAAVVAVVVVVVHANYIRCMAPHMGVIE